MRPISTLAVLLCCAFAPAQDAWTEFLAKREAGPDGQPRWLLVWLDTATNVASQKGDDTLLHLMVAQDLQVQPLSAPAKLALLNRTELPPNTAWVLLSPAGEIAEKGRGIPEGTKLLEILRRNGLEPRWERREAFLQTHPEQGEVLAEQLREALSLALTRMMQARLEKRIPSGTPEQFSPGCEIPNTSEGARFASDLLRPAREAFLRFLELPGPQPRPNFWIPSFMGPLELLGGHLAPDWQEPRTRFLHRLARDFEEDAEDVLLPLNLGQFGAEALPFLKAMIQSRIADPDQPWPPSNLLSAARVISRRVPEAEVLSLLDQVPLPPLGQEPTPEAWKDHLQTRQTLLGLKLQLQIRLERWSEAAQSLAELRSLGGQRLSKEDLGRRVPAKAREQAELKAILDLPPAPDPVPPLSPPPLRLVLLGQAPWLKIWLSLKDKATLATWSPRELRWEVAGVQEVTQIRSAQNWDAKPRWVLMREKQVLASGETCPEPEALAQRLAAEGPNRLQRLETYLQRHPEHRDVRRRRMRLLRERMPNPALEPLLVEDARLLEAQADLGPIPNWTPDPAAWPGAAQRVLPQVETTLEHWPGSTQTWRAWIAWSAFHPAQPSALKLAQRLPLWGNPGAWASQLPKEVHRAVGDELRRQGRFEEMRQWFQAAWDALDHRPPKDLPRWQQNWRAQQLRDWEEGILKPLREALKALRREPELQALERQWAVMQGKEVK